MWTRGLIALAAMVLLMASCASGSDAPEQANALVGEAEPVTSSSDGDESAEEAAPADDATAAVERTDDGPSVNESTSSPIGDALGFDPDDVLELNNNFIRAAEENVRQCMANAGFDYIPEDPGFGPSFARQLELEQSISEEQFVAEYGYGIATLFELNFQDEGVMGFVEALVGPPPADIRTPSEEEAYQLALYGRTIQGLSAEELQEQAFDVVGGDAEEGSCRQIGYDTAENPQGDIFDGLQSLLGDELDSLNDRFENDPRVRVATTDWQSCMAALGYSYDDAQQIRAEIADRANDIGQRLQQSPEARAIFGKAIEANLSDMDRDSRYDFLERAGAFQGFSMVPGLTAELDDLIGFELDTAQQSYDCSDRDVLRDVRIELEQRFVEDHADQLALVVAGETE